MMKYLEILNKRLADIGKTAEIVLFGGAVMCMVYGARSFTKDIDALFEPKGLIYKLSREIAADYDLADDWLNDAVKGFLSDKNDVKLYKKFSNLNVYVPSPEYLLAMKCLAARIDSSSDVDDIKFLLKKMNILDYKKAEAIILKYYPQHRFQAKTKFLLMDIIGEMNEK
ncbi:MAG: DUF6036 family nucleotidyltransferase [Proteiniphilum sp.]|nr:DUF6036 family nucleotidyltransferase [Proteiniphilum sp.]